MKRAQSIILILCMIGVGIIVLITAKEKSSAFAFFLIAGSIALVLIIEEIKKAKAKNQERNLRDILYQQEKLSQEMNKRTLYSYQSENINHINHIQTLAQIERAKMTPSLRYQVLKRDGFRCQICGRKASDGFTLHVDHIRPISKGGKTEMNNLRTLCDQCNLGKSDKYDEYGIN